MAVVIETTLGDITVDLYLDRRPVTCLNFLKLCKMKYYNFNLFHTIRNGFIAQTGDPTGEGSGGKSIWGILEGPDKRFFSAEKMPKIRHTDAGLLSMVCTGDMMVGSQFFFTLASDLDSLDGVHCVIGQVTEGHEVLRKLNEVICDETHRPYQDVRITHTVILEDPFNDPAGLRAPSRSPSPSAERLKGGRIAPDEDLDETQGKSAAEIQEMIEEKEAAARATILEIVGDLPDADIAPPENVLFVCKLNPVTSDEDLEIIFSRFGKIVSCEVIRDKKTGDSLQYAFIEFEDKKSCEDAYFKMDNVLIDDRRIHVDFSQSVSKIQWLGKGRGVRHIKDDDDPKDKLNRTKSRRSESRERDRSKSDKRENYRNENRDKYRERESSNYKNRSEKDLRTTRSQRDRSRTKIESSKDRSYKNREHREKNHKPREDKKSRSRNHYKEQDSIRYEDDQKRSDKPPSKRNRDNRHPSPIRENKNYINENKHHESREKRNKYELNEYKSKEKSVSKHKNDKSESDKHRSQDESHKGSKIIKRDEPRTPSPLTKKKKLKNGNNVNEKRKKGSKNKQVKKKRKESTSSSSESDTSSESSTSDTSSSSSSSSDSDKKEKKCRRKRKYSSSSSSETSSSSSSESSTSSSSSDSEDDRKKRKKNASKGQIKKSKNKS